MSRQPKEEPGVDAKTRGLLKGYDFDSLTTVLPRLEGQASYTVMERFRNLGIPGYRNGARVPTTTDQKEKRP